jgi:hypothetical protein
LEKPKVVEHRFEHAMPYPWGGYRFVCSCGLAGPVVDTVGAARAEHDRHAASEAADRG